jgi:uncharacterized cysteine cluster protein YcgN (CxxCxxCC family)
MYLAYEFNHNMFAATDKSLQITQDCHITMPCVQLASNILLKMDDIPVSCPVVSAHSCFKVYKYSRYITKGKSENKHTKHNNKYNSKLSKLAEINLLKPSGFFTYHQV